MSRSETVAGGAVVAAAIFLLSLETILPLDDAVYRSVQFGRTCELQSAARSIDSWVRAVVAALASAVLLTGGWRRPARVALFAILFASGAAAGELLKTVFERMRPNESPGDLSGNSFPSGHVMNTTMAVVAVLELAREAGWPKAARAVTGLAGACVIGAQVFFRLVNGSHWVSDAAASILLGIAWMHGARSLFARSGVAAGALAVAGAAAFGLFYHDPSVRLRLPSVLTATRPTLVAVDASTARLAGRWSHGWREPVGPVAWALEPAVGVELGAVDGRAAVALPQSFPGGLLRAVLRPPGEWEGARGCQRVVVSLNGWAAPPIVLLEGWREYRFPIPPRVLRADRNEARLSILDDLREPGSRAPGITAFHSLRIESD